MVALETLGLVGVMPGSLFSNAWYKVADLHVRLRKHATIHRHIYRGKVWYVLQDHATGQFQRFSPQAYQLIGLMDGSKTLQQIWDAGCQRLGDDLPTQDELIQLVAELNKANVIQTDTLPDIEQLQRRRWEQQRSKFIQQLKSPLSIRIPMLDPEYFLAKCMPLINIIFSRFGGLLWLLIVILGGALAVIHWRGLTDNLSDRLFALQNIMLMALAYPLVKVIHELGHAFAVKRWGGEVHEMGVMLLVFFPVPYVDASAATSFRNKYQRMLVGAVGILGELLIASIAMIVWVSVEPGGIRALAFNVMLIGGISTLIFNGNPLLRFDAYYVLADYLETPNLGSRGNSQVGYLLKCYIFGVRGLKSAAKSASESAWLASYSIAAYIYRLFVMVAISSFIASQYLFIGVLLACWSVWASLLMPIMKILPKPLTDPQLRRKRTRIFTISGGVIGATLLLLLAVPVPYKTYSQGVLYVPQEAFIRSPVNGFVDALMVPIGSHVQPETLLISLKAPDLIAEAKVLAAQVNEADIRYQASVNDRTTSDILLQELNFIKQEYMQAQTHLASLDIYSHAEGEFFISDLDGITGKYVQRGEMISFVIDYQNLPMTVMIPEDDIDMVKNQTRAIELRFVSDPQTTYKGSILRHIPASTQQLPSATLSTDGGGMIALDPQASQGLKSYQSYFRIELDVPNAIKTV